jgi:hypothetical protein
MTTNTTKDTRAEDQAKEQVSSLVDMVAALEVDYDRIEDLEEERQNFLDVCEDESLSQEERKRDGWDKYEEWKEEGYLDELKEMKAAAGDCESRDDAYERIQEDPLSIELRSGWYSPGDTPEPEEFCILLCTGGPAVRIIGELDQYRQPCRAWIEYQDWFTPWTELVDISSEERDAILTYCQQFYFGE